MKIIGLLVAIAVLVLATFTAGATISGRMVDAETLVPLPGDAPGFSTVNIYRYDPVTNFREFIIGTRCYGGERDGCADADGKFVFEGNRYDDSPLEEGNYGVDISAQGYLVRRLAFSLGSTGVDLGTIEVQSSPVKMTLISFSFPPPISSGNGEVLWRVVVENLTEGPQKLETYTLVSGPTETTVSSTDILVGRPKKVVVDPLRAKLIDGSLQVPGELPDGTNLCLRIYVRETRQPFVIFGQVGFCVSKGTTTPPPKG